MAEQLRHVFHLLLLVSILLFRSTAAQYSYDYEEGSPADASSVSYISATPDASPVAAPGPDASYNDQEVDAPSSQQELSLHTSNVLSSTQGEDDAFGTSYGTMLAVETKRSGHNEIEAAGRAGVNRFLHSMLVASVSKTDKFMENVIMKRLRDTKVDSYTKECLETCKEVYVDSVGAMKKTMGDIQEGNYFKANVDVSAMSNDVDICKECVEQVIGDDLEFDMFNKWLDVVTDKLLGKITGISS